MFLALRAIAPVAARDVVYGVFDADPAAVLEDLARAINERREPTLAARSCGQPREPFVGRVRIRKCALADKDVEALPERHERAAGDLGRVLDDRLPVEPHRGGS